MCEGKQDCKNKKLYDLFMKKHLRWETEVLEGSFIRETNLVNILGKILEENTFAFILL
jgi:hypothetical protein